MLESLNKFSISLSFESSERFNRRRRRIISSTRHIGTMQHAFAQRKLNELGNSYYVGTEPLSEFGLNL